VVASIVRRRKVRCRYQQNKSGGQSHGRSYTNQEMSHVERL